MNAPLPAPNAPPATTPAIGGTVKIDIGDMAEQLIVLAKAYAEKMVALGEPIALAAIPMGSLIGEFITPQVIDGYIEQAADAASKQVAGASVSFTANDIVVGLFKSGQPHLNEFLKDDVEPLFAKAMAAIKKL